MGASVESRRWIPERIREWIRVAELRRELCRLEEHYRSAMDRASDVNAQQLSSEWDFESGWPLAELGAIYSRRTMRKARRWGVIVPHSHDNGWWTTHIESSRRYLTDYGQQNARKLIRAEFRDSVKWWVDLASPVIGMLTGLTGALIGLVALLK